MSYAKRQSDKSGVSNTMGGGFNYNVGESKG